MPVVFTPRMINGMLMCIYPLAHHVTVRRASGILYKVLWLFYTFSWLTYDERRASLDLMA